VIEYLPSICEAGVGWGGLILNTKNKEDGEEEKIVEEIASICCP
jgi:hypothetical protein